MKNCNYIYTTKNGDHYENRSLLFLLQDLIFLKKVGKLQNLEIYSKIQAFDTTNENVFNKATQEIKGAQSFSKLFYPSTTPIIPDFNIKFGTLVHNFIKEKLEIIKNGGNPSLHITNEEYDKMWKNVILEGSKDANTFKDDIQSKYGTGSDKDNLNSYLENMFKLLLNVANLNHYDIVLIEKSIYWKSEKGGKLPVMAIPDLILKKKNSEEYIIVDYKVSNSDKVKDNDDYFAQLKFIELILIKNGLKANKITLLNWQIKRIDNSVTPITRTGVTSMTHHAMRFINNIFDVNALDSENINENVLQSIRDQFNGLKSIIEKGRGIYNTSEQSYKEYLTKIFKTHTKAYYKNASYDYKLNPDGTVRLKNKEDEVVFNSFEDFTNAMWLEHTSEYKNAINNIINHLYDIESLEEAVRQDPNNEVLKRLLINLRQYDLKSGRWDIHRLGSLTDELGLILLYNQETKKYDVLKLSNITDFTINTGTNGRLFQNPDKNTVSEGGVLLLENLLPKNIINKYGNKTPEATLGNLELFETMLLVDMLKDILRNNEVGQFLLGAINLISATSGSIHADTKLHNYKSYEDAFAILKREKEHILKNPILDNQTWDFFNTFKLSELEEILSEKIISIMTKIGEKWSDFNFSDSTVLLSERLEEIEKLKKEMSDLPESPVKTELLNAIIELQLFLQNIRPNTVFEELKYGVADPLNVIGTIWDALFNTYVKEMSADGTHITGIGGGLQSASSYQNPDEAIRHLLNVQRNITLQMTEKVLDEYDEVKHAGIKYIKAIGKNGILGKFQNDENPFKRLFVENNQGDIDDSLTLKNPYVSNSLTSAEREYLEVFLFAINKHRMHLLKDKHNVTYKEFSTDTKYKHDFETYKTEIEQDNTVYLRAPLKLKYGLRGTLATAVASFKTGGGWIELKNTIKAQLMSSDPNTIGEKQLREKQSAKKKNKIPFLYPKNNVSSYNTMIQNNGGVDKFILNLDYLASDFIMESIRQELMLKYLDTANLTIGYLNALELATGIDLSKQRETIENDIILNIHYEDTAEKEFKPLLGVTGAIKKGISVATIGLRPLLWVKEEVLGFIKNFSHSIAKWIQNENPITAKLIAKAYRIVLPENHIKEAAVSLGIKDGDEYSKVRLINDFWRINGRDLSMFSKTIAAHKTIFNFDNGIIYHNVTSPDNDNRMIIVVAKMLADGTWDAMEVKNGKLVYNPRKDARFSYFFDHRHKDAQMKSDSKYTLQKALYEMYIAELNSQGYNITISSDPKDWGLIPVPYTNKQISSLKELIGMMYGFYNHEERDLTSFGTFKRLYTQFVTWLPGELRRYFATGDASSVGKYVHLTDLEGNLLYIHTDPETGLQTKTTLSHINGEALPPAYGWQGHPVTGLAISAAKTFHAVMTLDKEFFKNKNNKQIIRNFGLFLFNLIFGCIMGTILSGAFSDEKAKKEEADKKTLAMLDLGQKVFNELNFINSFAGATDLLNILAVNYMKDLYKKTYRAIGNEDYNLFNFSVDNVAAIRDIQYLS